MKLLLREPTAGWETARGSWKADIFRRIVSTIPSRIARGVIPDVIVAGDETCCASA